ncbi:MAG: type pilus assembly protein PilB, partial [Frankiaceae bacterium]|nr:type pilus assembly protein PilB [Frankiaceae bacterium]
MALRRPKIEGKHVGAPGAVDAAIPAQAQPSDGGKPRLGELLVQRTRVTHKQVAEALLQQSASGKPIGRLLVELGGLTDRELAQSLAEQMELALVDLAQEQPEPEAIKCISEAIARSETVVPMMKTAEALVVAVAEPSPDLYRTLMAASSLPITMVVAPSGDIKRAIDASYRALTDVDSHVTAFQQAEAGRAKAPTAKSVAADATSAAATADAPVVQLVNKILVQALRDRASDVHVEPQDDRLRVRFRIDGALHDVLALPADIGPALVSRIKIMAGMNIVERRRPQDGQLAMTIDGRDIDVRVATVGVHWGEKTVMRVLDKSRSLYKLG